MNIFQKIFLRFFRKTVQTAGEAALDAAVPVVTDGLLQAAAHLKPATVVNAAIVIDRQPQPVAPAITGTIVIPAPGTGVFVANTVVATDATPAPVEGK